MSRLRIGCPNCENLGIKYGDSIFDENSHTNGSWKVIFGICILEIDYCPFCGLKLLDLCDHCNEFSFHKITVDQDGETKITHNYCVQHWEDLGLAHE